MADLSTSPWPALQIYRRLVGARIRADFQYRLSFVLYTAGQASASAVDLLEILVIFTQVHALGGWSFDEILFLYGTSGTSFALGDLFVSPVERAAFHIKAGSFDQFLIRPVSPLLQLSASEFAFRRVGKFAQPAIVLVAAIVRLPVTWTPERAAVVVVAILAGGVIFSSIWVITSAIAFWTVETQEVANTFTYGGSYVSSYPMDVLGTWLRRAAIFVPVAFITYLPVGWVLGKPDVYDLPLAIRLASPVVAMALALVASSLWKFAIRHYRSTGT